LPKARAKKELTPEEREAKRKRDRRKSKGVSLQGGGMTMSILELLQHIVNEPAPKLTPESRFPAEAHEFVEMCLFKDPEQRWNPQQLLVSVFQQAHARPTARTARACYYSLISVNYGWLIGVVIYRNTRGACMHERLILISKYGQVRSDACVCDGVNSVSTVWYSVTRPNLCWDEPRSFVIVAMSFGLHQCKMLRLEYSWVFVEIIGHFYFESKK
jgi:serine/threonine protein kinase